MSDGRKGPVTEKVILKSKKLFTKNEWFLLDVGMSGQTRDTFLNLGRKFQIAFIH